MLFKCDDFYMNWNWDDQPGPCKLWCYSYVLGNGERLLSGKLSCFDDSGFLSIIVNFFFLPSVVVYIQLSHDAVCLPKL